MSASGEPYELPIHVERADIDELGHANNVIYLRWVQEAAAAHWTAIAPATERARLLWVVLRHEIDYKQGAYLDEELVARTWVGTATRVRFDRHTEIVRAQDRALLARARTVWCPLDAETKRPTTVSQEVRSLFSVPALATDL